MTERDLDKVYTLHQMELLKNFGDIIVLRSAIYHRPKHTVYRNSGEWIDRKTELSLVNKKLVELFNDCLDADLLAEMIEFQKAHNEEVKKTGGTPFPQDYFG